MSSEGAGPVREVRVAESGRKAQGRWVMLGVFGAFLLPLLLAVYLYVNLDIWKPSTRVNHGELMDPVRPLTLLAAQDADGNAVPLERLQHIWTLLYVAEGDCLLECQAALFKMRQAQAMLGRDLTRVQYGYLAIGERAAETADAYRNQHPLMLWARVPDTQRDAQLMAVDGEKSVGGAYLIDPHGNLVLRYGPDATTKGMLKDLHRLLKVSRIG